MIIKYYQSITCGSGRITSLMLSSSPHLRAYQKCSNIGCVTEEFTCCNNALVHEAPGRLIEIMASSRNLLPIISKNPFFRRACLLSTFLCPVERKPTQSWAGYLRVMHWFSCDKISSLWPCFFDKFVQETGLGTGSPRGCNLVQEKGP